MTDLHEAYEELMTVLADKAHLKDESIIQQNLKAQKRKSVPTGKDDNYYLRLALTPRTLHEAGCNGAELSGIVTNTLGE